jgi:hypothetical protein
LKIVAVILAAYMEALLDNASDFKIFCLRCGDGHRNPAGLKDSRAILTESDPSQGPVQPLNCQARITTPFRGWSEPSAAMLRAATLLGAEAGYGDLGKPPSLTLQGLMDGVPIG